jgi:plasmid maintenance system antidote protein VapI
MERFIPELHQPPKIELPPDIESDIREALSPDTKLDIVFDHSSIYLTLERLREQYSNIENSALIAEVLKDIDEKIVENNKNITTIENAKNLIKNFDEAKAKLLTLQLEYSMLRQQLESQLDNGLELKGTPIQDALDQYRRFKSKLEGLSEDSPEQEDIRRVLNIYSKYIKKEFEQSSERYAIGNSHPVDIDIEKIVDNFVEPNNLTREQMRRQNDIAEARQNITAELSKTPGVLGVIPMTIETEGSKNFDIIAITLKPDTNLSPEEINTALKLLYSQIQDSAKSRQDLIEDNRLDTNNIEMYVNGSLLLDMTETEQLDLRLNPAQIFQLHPIKVAKRYSDVQYDEAYSKQSMAQARPSRSLGDYSNIPTLTNSYNSKDGKVQFNQAMFQLSAQRALNLYLA